MFQAQVFQGLITNVINLIRLVIPRNVNPLSPGPEYPGVLSRLLAGDWRGPGAAAGLLHDLRDQRLQAPHQPGPTGQVTNSNTHHHII